MKYKFNPKSLSFEKAEKTAGQILKTIGSYTATAIAFAVVVLLIWNVFFDSPKEKRLKRQIKEYNIAISQMEKRVDLLSNVVLDLQKKDNSLYRSLLEANPTSEPLTMEELTNMAAGQKMADNDALTRLQLKAEWLTAATQKQLSSYEDLWHKAQHKEEIYQHIPAISPVKNPKVVSGFGTRFHPIYKILRRHTGIDFIGKKGTPIYATADGRVIQGTGQTGYGITITIDHGNGYQTLYAHLSKKTAKPGQKVKRGEIIGYMGSTGLSSGTHLHYEVIKDGIKVNPVQYFFADLTPEEYSQILQQASEINQAMS